MSVCRIFRSLAGIFVWLALAAPVTAATVSVAWNANPESDVTGYNLFISTQPGVFTTPISVGNRTTWTFPGLQPGVQYYFAVQAISPGGLSGLAQIAHVPPIPFPAGSEPSRSDFNGDGWFDVLWQHTSGQLAVWHLNATSVVWARLLSTPAVAPAWRLSGSGDFNQDGKPDLVWHNQQNGQVVYWLMNGVSDWASGYFPGPVSPDWRIASVRDFDLDGHPDLWWHNQVTGEMVVWYFNGVTHVRTSTPNPGRITDVNWKLAGTADFTGDGRPDALWHNHATGELRVWGLNGITHVSTPPMNPQYVAPGWKIAAIGDANLDGAPDILWQSDTTGGLVLWKMNGTNQISGEFLSIPSADLSWKIMAPK